jgi:hypothetical protein
MNYQLIYDNLISKAKERSAVVGEYTERHHIVPKAFNGSDDAENLVNLTLREHFVAHRLLDKIHPNTKMAYAVWFMACVNGEHRKVTGRTFAILREGFLARIATDEEAKRKKSKALRGKKQSPEHIANRVKSRKTTGEWHSEETIEKISQSRVGGPGPWKGKNLSLAMIKKRKATMSERNAWKSPWTEEKRIAQSERLKGKPQRKKPLTEVKREHLRIEKSKKVTCPHCGKVGQMMVMPRWHFDNCKLKPGSEPASTGKELSHD